MQESRDVLGRAAGKKGESVTYRCDLQGPGSASDKLIGQVVSSEALYMFSGVSASFFDYLGTRSYTITSVSGTEWITECPCGRIDASPRKK